ncbi:MAG: substrate-binding domain-containing protein [Pseudacidovorax sp.]|nr:substrate-binding domain-containing protein [Pseudacidovorax sp.]
MTAPLTLISSMATRQILNDLAADYERRTGQAVKVESVGGVDAAKRVQAGEAFDLVVLAANAIDQLAAAGKTAGPRKDLVTSGVAVAVKAGAPRPAIDSEEAVKQAVLGAQSLAYSTGPSGVQLAKLFERWGIAAEIQPRIVTAPPGVPVGSLVAKGEVALGFQQLSEMLNLEGIDILGPLPDAIQIVTTFSGAVAATSGRAAEAQAVLDFMASPEAAGAIRRQGMEPA